MLPVILGDRNQRRVPAVFCNGRHSNKIQMRILMKKNLSISFLALLAGSLLAADSSPKDDVITAAKSLADKPNYSWKQNSENAGGGGGGRFGGPSEGQTEKDGITHISMTMGDNKMEFVIKGDKGARKTEDGWE